VYTHGQTLEAWHDGREEGVRADEGTSFRVPRTRTKRTKIGSSLRMSQEEKVKKTNKKKEKVGKIVRL
jgi:hypothetical protein